MASSPRSVLLVSPWHGGSHGAWAEGLARHSRHRVHLVTHADRHWRWRLRGAALTLADEAAAVVAEHGPPDVVLATDMVDLAAFLGAARRSLGDPAVALYLHESQLVRPTGEAPPSARRRRGSTSSPPDAEVVFTNWRSMAVADVVLVNSQHHLDQLAGALPGFLAGAPDHPHALRLDAVLDRCVVLPVGCELAALLAGERRSTAPPAGGDAPLVVWNQRWDHDKDPVAFLRVVRGLAREGVPFRLALAGENRRVDPQEFRAAIDELGPRVVHHEHVDVDDYRALLLRGDVVLSTAVHEFFGVAPVEAMAAGCVPLLPDRLSYPELVPAPFHGAVLYRARPADRLRSVLTDLPAARARVDGLRSAMARWSWEALVPRYDEAIDRLAAEYGRRP